MNDLQIALTGAGIAAIGAVWGYNVWQERKHRRTAERLFKGEPDDVLLKDAPASQSVSASPSPVVEERIEPTASFAEPAEPMEPLVPLVPHENDTLATTPPPADVTAPPVVAAVPIAADVMAAAVAPPLPGDRLAEALARIELTAPLAATELLAARAALSAAISKPQTWWACNPGDAAWHRLELTDAGRYSDWAVALQLADRRGPVSEGELARFEQDMQRLAESHGGRVSLPDADESWQRAQALDGFCAGVDIQIGVHVVEASGGSFSGTKLRGVLEAAGLRLEADGCFHAADADGAAQFWVANIGNVPFDAESMKSLSTQGITLTIDVPRVVQGGESFDRLLNCGRQLARGLGGVLVDVQRAPLADAMISAIRAKIVEIQEQMRAADIPAGGERALKLFS